MNPRTLVLTVACLTLMMSGCTESAPDADRDPDATDGGPSNADSTDPDPTDEESAPEYGTRSFDWQVDGENTLSVTVTHPGGTLDMTLRHDGGTLTTYELVDGDSCDGAMGGGSTQPEGPNTHTDYDISCPDTEAGEIAIEIRLTGVAEGSLLVENVELAA